MNDRSTRDERRELAEAVRRACLETAQNAYTDAAMRGLCKEGAWENALEAVRSLDLETVIESATGDEPGM